MGSILDPFGSHFGSEIVQEAIWKQLGGLLKAALIFLLVLGSVPGRPGGRGGVIRRHPAYVGSLVRLEAKPSILEKTLLGVESQR